METPTAVAPETTAPAAPVQTFDIQSLNTEQRSHWQRTGEWPKTDATASEPATPAKPAESEPAPSEVEKSAKTAPESEPGKTIEEPKAETPEERSERDRRYQARRLTRTNRELGEVRAENKRLKEALAGRTPTAQPEAAPGTARVERPNLETFNGTYPEYEQLLEKSLRADERAKVLAEFQQQQQQTETQQLHQTWDQKVQSFLAPKAAANPQARAEFNEDFDHVADALDGTPGDRVLSELTVDSDLAPAIIQRLADNPKELQELRSAKTLKAASLVIERLETAVKGAVPPTRKITRASSPTSEVAGRDSTSMSEEEAAFKRGDFNEYKRLMNAKDLASRGR